MGFCEQCQDTLVQFIGFLSLQLSCDELVKRLPNIQELLTSYHIPVEIAFALWRIVYSASISVSCSLWAFILFNLLKVAHKTFITLKKSSHQLQLYQSCVLTEIKLQLC